MARLMNELIAKRIVHFYEINGGRENSQSNKLTIKHFSEEGIRYQTIARIIKRYNTRGSIDYMKILGRPPFRSVDKVKKLYERKPETSVRIGSLKTNMPISTFQYIKKKKLKINAFVQQTVPKYINDQIPRARKACRILYKKTLTSGGNKVLILDDETYVPQDPQQIPGKNYFHAQNKTSVKDNVRFKPKQKFSKRFLVWQAIDQNGNTSEPFIHEGTINAKVYLEECLTKRLLPFIEKYHKTNDILFWPDLATAHYQKDVISWLESKNIEFVKRNQNTPNVPQVRPIERFWALCKKEYKIHNKMPKTLNGFKRIWCNISKRVADKSAQNLMRHLKRKLRAVAYKGVLEPFKLANL